MGFENDGCLWLLARVMLLLVALGCLFLGTMEVCKWRQEQRLQPLKVLFLLFLLLVMPRAFGKALNKSTHNWRQRVPTVSRTSGDVVIGEFVSAVITEHYSLNFTERPNPATKGV